MARGFWRGIEPGSLDKRVTFLRQEKGEDAFGKTTNSLAEVITLWADFYPVRGKEFYEVRHTEGEVTHKCYCRWHSAIADIDSTWYIRFRGNLYSIESAIDAGFDRRYFEIYCTQHIDKEALVAEEEFSEIAGGDDE